MKQHPLKAERMLRGWSQSRVANILNTTVRTISRWELGQALPYPFYREQLCQLFGKDARQLGLLPGQEEEENIFPEESPISQPVEPAFPQTLALSPSFQPSMFIDPTIPEALGSSSGLLGRKQIIQQAKRLSFEKGRIALYGLPGVGKTALAVALATDPQSQARFPDGILWAGLGPQPDILAVLVRWGKLFGITPAEVEDASNPEDWRRAIQAAIGGRSLFVVIDDAWNIMDAFALQVGGIHCASLLTTRSPQVAFAFAQEGNLAVHELAEADSLALLARFVPQLARQKEAHFLVREVSGLPLALTLVGKYLAANCLSGQPYRIQRALEHLHQAEQMLQIRGTDRSSSTLPLDIPFSLHTTIALSDQHLSSTARRALYALSAFPAKPASFTEEAALKVSEESIEILDELWDAGLLESDGPGRYCLHQTIVNYAQMQGENATAKRRLVYYVLAYVNEHQRHYELLEREAPVLWTALENASGLEMWSELVRGTLELVPFLLVRGLYSQGSRVLQQALQATLHLEDQLARTMVLFRLANFTDLLGDNARAETYGQQGLELARRLGRQELVSSFLYLLGDIWRKRENYAQARHFLEEGLYLARPLGDLELICHLLNSFAAVLYRQGEDKASGAYYAEALALARQARSQELISRQLASLSTFEQEQGNYAQAEAYCREGMQLAWQVEYQEQRCLHLNMLGLIAVRQKAYSQAEAYYQEALALARQIGHRAHICTLLMNLGELSAIRSDYIRAERYNKEGVELARQMGSRHTLATLLMRLGHAMGQREETYQQAIVCFQECLEIVQALTEPKLLKTLFLLWGEIHLKHQPPEKPGQMGPDSSEQPLLE